MVKHSVSRANFADRQNSSITVCAATSGGMEIKMSAIISEYIEKSQIITPDDEYHYFFGYYDMRATIGDKPHLCHRVRFMDRLPDENDVCEVGYLVDRKFIKIGETTAWNFQQGAMLQYHPYLEDTVYYNVFEDGKFHTVTHNFARSAYFFSPVAKL